MENQVKQNHEMELLKLEYQECQDGYNSRDRMVEDEFCKLVQIFPIFLAILVAFERFAEVGPCFYCMVCVIIGIAGLFCLFSLLVSMESNASCNVALRMRCREIEKRLQELSGFELKYWQVINTRARHFEEKLVKGKRGTRAVREKKEAERNIFIVTVRLLVILWTIIFIYTSLRGTLSI